MSTSEIVGFGALNMDSILQVTQIVTEGEAVVNDLKQYPGGSAANTVYALARLGASAGFVGAVGNDSDGKKLVRALARAGVDTSGIKTKPVGTGTALCLSDTLGQRAIYLHPGANSLLDADDINMDYLDRARIVHLSSFVDDRQFALQIEVARRLKRPAMLSLAPGMLYASRGLESLSPLVGKADMLFLNRQELRTLTGSDFRAGAIELLKVGCRTVVVTLGSGVVRKRRKVVAYVRSGPEEHYLPLGGTASVVDATGAGDAFAAGFLFGILNGKGLSECARMGEVLARRAIRRAGARTGLPTAAQFVRDCARSAGLSIPRKVAPSR